VADHELQSKIRSPKITEAKQLAVCDRDTIVVVDASKRYGSCARPRFYEKGPNIGFCSSTTYPAMRTS
jgi:hypothetical protein